ncbi:hypothetical protein [Streptomyces longispororuber]|uniref:hypothetical protein n=1 Tax=Streptomyces longispororuber TaxID=68230 RepID=UPI00167E7F4D|nr:hypothetical protein [Streptomyces longispororuber]
MDVPVVGRMFHWPEQGELGMQPDAYDPKLDVDFTLLRGDEPAAEGFSRAA